MGLNEADHRPYRTSTDKVTNKVDGTALTYGLDISYDSEDDKVNKRYWSRDEDGNQDSDTHEEFLSGESESGAEIGESEEEMSDEGEDEDDISEDTDEDASEEESND
jgi:hypothetical protein